MTPERVGILSIQAMQEAQEIGPSRAIERAIRQAVNEALEEAANACIDSLTYDEDDPASTYAAIVRALKLPEEE